LNSREQIKKQVHDAAVVAGERLDALRQELARCADPDRRRLLSLRIQAAAVERDKCLAALFVTPRTL